MKMQRKNLTSLDHDRNEVLRIARNPIDPFVGIPFFIAKLSERQYCCRVFEDFQSQEYIQFFDIHNCLFMRLHFSIGGNDYRRTTRFRQSIHFASLKSFLLIMCIDAPESTTNSLSSRLRVDAGRHQFSEGEKNAALWCSFNFNTLLASFHAASRAPCSCHSVSSWDQSSNFGALGLRWWGSPGQMYPSEGFWSQILRVLDGFFEFRILGVDEIDSTQFSCVFKMNLFLRPLLLFLQLCMLSHWFPELWP